MSIPIIQVDSFTNTPFHGNPAAVCLLREEPTPAWMQNVAAEMNLSETAFLLQKAESEYAIRWFTPAVEVPLCGHATLASAHVLWQDRLVPPEQTITFHPRQGRLTAQRDADWIRLDFPAVPVEPCPEPADLGAVLGVQPARTCRSSMPALLAELDSEATVRNLRPDMTRLRALDFDACIVTARSDSEACDFVSRFFAPAIGIDEDPVTGAAHCSLGPYWAERLGKSELTGHQVSRRGGTVRIRVRGDRVDLLGQAITVLRGELAPAT
jgi:PhzF family phenazine biosynthesis protein